ncbi:outer membrane lipid asymmetry maintenance protein MlaD [Motiliproteus sp. SC1-56]|uniref:outer membrane lipid asymmetry maintenance protein MlaD n=1 Tax=Motiliproteus sp. SC1-56 TaxID=2799565 RepID=UPI001A8F2F34|nr:outer membrane lipid asymmetry maintenance protein MlaD [Motiliproteus sp. SC1-56]
MRMRTLEIGVGAFILAGFLALVVLIINVSGLSLSEAKDSYKVYARFENAGGLTVRSKVTLSGVGIGQVTDIRIDDEWLMAMVEMEIDQDVNYLSRDSSAAILTAGLLGEKYIGITVGASEEMLGEGDMIEDTQSALVLEELIGKFLFDKVKEP